MYNEDAQEQQAYEPRPSRGIEVAGNKQMSLMELAEQEMMMLEKLHENIKILTERLSPVRDEMPTDSVEGNVKEPQMNKLGGRLNYIMTQTRRAANAINSLTREINL